MDSWPKISIITPSFNQVGYLERTIRSVLDQNYPNLEYIIIDGGSTDGSIDIIRKYEQQLSYWCSEPDGGQSAALNKGFRRTTGDIVGWLNSDDLYCPGTLFDVGRHFIQHSDTDVFYGSLYIVDAEDRLLDAYWAGPFGILQRSYIFYVGLNFHQQTLFWRRELMNKTGLIDETLKFSMDRDFIIRMLMHGRFAGKRGYLGVFRIHGEAKSSTILETSIEEDLIIRQRYKGYFPKIVGNASLNHILLRFIRFLNLMYDAPISYLACKIGKKFHLPVPIDWLQQERYLVSKVENTDT